MITGKNSQYNSIADLKGTTIGISRYGRYVFSCQAVAPSHEYDSGSQTMAYVMALQQGWPTNELKFKGWSTHRLRFYMPLT